MVPTLTTGVQPTTATIDEILLGLELDMLLTEGEQTPPPTVVLRAEWAIKLPTHALDSTEARYFRSQEDINTSPNGSEPTIYRTRAAAEAVRDIQIWAAEALQQTTGKYRPRLVTRAVMQSATGIVHTPWQLVDEDGER